MGNKENVFNKNLEESNTSEEQDKQQKSAEETIGTEEQDSKEKEEINKVEKNRRGEDTQTNKIRLQLTWKKSYWRSGNRNQEKKSKITNLKKSR